MPSESDSTPTATAVHRKPQEMTAAELESHVDRMKRRHRDILKELNALLRLAKKAESEGRTVGV